ncbi:unnamed protein product [Phaeothamnion confervicola]
MQEGGSVTILTKHLLVIAATVAATVRGFRRPCVCVFAARTDAGGRDCRPLPLPAGSWYYCRRSSAKHEYFAHVGFPFHLAHLLGLGQRHFAPIECQTHRSTGEMVKQCRHTRVRPRQRPPRPRGACAGTLLPLQSRGTNQSCDLAAAAGHLDTLHWGHTHRVTWTESACRGQRALARRGLDLRKRLPHGFPGSLRRILP